MTEVYKAIDSDGDFVQARLSGAYVDLVVVDTGDEIPDAGIDVVGRTTLSVTRVDFLAIADAIRELDSASTEWVELAADEVVSGDVVKIIQKSARQTVHGPFTISEIRGWRESLSLIDDEEDTVWSRESCRDLYRFERKA